MAIAPGMNDKAERMATAITARQQKIEDLTERILAEPTARHLRPLPVDRQLTMGALLDLAAAVSGWPPSAIDKLSARDAMKVAEALSGFLGQETETSPTPPS
ncbi:MAG: phage tail assembly protein [Candidatus Accumulibacter sp.]|jgi:hypothetical protein|nr:phage tail assembly protein [Accumulibacter sp.]